MLSKEFNGNVLSVCLYIKLPYKTVVCHTEKRPTRLFGFFFCITFNLTRKRIASQCKRFALASLHKILSQRENVKCLAEEQNAELSSI